jgi:hypothetical protein
MPQPLLPWFLGLGLNRTLRQILENQELILTELRMHGRGLSKEDRFVLERAIARLEALAAER